MAAQGNDCRFYYNSTCDKGRRCPFRHSEPARFSTTTCRFWKSGRCTKTNCCYRHSVITQDQKSFCFYENQPGGCTRPNCSYIHERPRHRLQYHEDMSDTHAMGPCLNSRSSSRSSSCSPSPSTPTMVDSTSNSIMLAWTEPEEEWEDTCIESYKIGYREYNKNHSKWALFNTKNTQTLFRVDGLKGETEYEFTVCAVDGEGNDGPFSFPPVVMSTRQSPARYVKRKSIKIKDGNPNFYKIPLEKSRNTTNKYAKTKKCFFVDHPDRPDPSIQRTFQVQTVMKTILKMTKQQLKSEIKRQTPVIEQLQDHGPMDTKTIDQMRLTLLTAAVYETRQQQ